MVISFQRDAWLLTNRVARLIFAGVKAIRKYIAFLVLTAILVSGNGIGFSIHTCLASSTKSISLLDKKCRCNDTHDKDCGSEDHDAFQSKCCTYEYNFYKLSHSSQIKDHQPVDFSLIQTQTPLLVFEQPRSVKISDSDFSHWYPDDFSVLFCSLLI